MLNRQRAARMNAFHAADPSLPGFDEVLGALTKIGWYGQREAGMAGAVQRNTAEQLLTRLVAVAADSTAHSQVRAQAFQTLQQIDRWLSKQKPGKPDADWAAHHAHARHLISAFMRDPAKYEPGKTPTAPPGSPIGN